MALRIGKKKDAPADLTANSTTNAPTDDWSDAALLGQSGNTTPAPTPAVAPGAAPDPADNFAPAAQPKAKSPALLAGGLVLLLTAVGVGAYFAFFNKPSVDESIPAPPPRVARAPMTPTRPGIVAKPTTAAQPKTPVSTKAKTPAEINAERWGRAGITTPNDKAPALRAPGGQPAVVPRPNMPTPMPLMSDGQAGQPGKGSSPTATTVQVVSPLSVLPPALQAQLKALWKQGADAKHQRNYAGARRAWTKMLQLRPGHPGVREAIEKLPR